MLEAVGRAHWARFFARCDALLEDGGLMGLQVITVPDHRFARYLRRCDWIQKHIFPGGILPSLGALARAMSRDARFSIRHLDDVGPHYAETLSRWRTSFLARRDEARALGLDDRFIRMWDYYLGSCEGAFRARALGDLQLVVGRAV
jgi:cyclopropane-fatty-acyl-phospholipid synthase